MSPSVDLVGLLSGWLVDRSDGRSVGFALNSYIFICFYLSTCFFYVSAPPLVIIQLTDAENCINVHAKFYLISFSLTPNSNR